VRGAVLPARGTSRARSRWREGRRIRGGVTLISVQVSPRAVRDTPSPHSGGVGESISSAFPYFAMQRNREPRADTASPRRAGAPLAKGEPMQLFAVYAHPIPKCGLRAE